MYRVPLFHDESLTSYCSRLAAANVKTAPDFCLDMGIRFQDVIQATDFAVKKLAEIGDLPIESILRAAIGKKGDSWIVGGEAINNKFYVRTQLRICPRCFEEDARALDRMPGVRHYMRRSWSLQFVRTCPDHNCALNDFGRSPLHAIRCHDFIDSLMASDIGPGFGQVRPRTLSGFERFSLDRLEGIRRHGDTLDTMPLERGGYLCEVLGIALLYGNNTDQAAIDEDQLWHAGEKGYQYLSKGRDGLRDALDVFHGRLELNKSDFGGGKLYGRFYKILWDQRDPVWDQIKRDIHDYAFEALPLSQTANVFGTSKKASHISETELRTQFGLRPSHLRKMAVALGMLDAASAKSGAVPKDVARKVAEILADSLLAKKAAGVLGITYPKFAKYRRAGIFEPVIVPGNGVTLSERFSKRALEAFLESIYPAVGSPVAEGLKPINVAAKLARCRDSDVLKLVHDKKLKRVGWDNGKVGLEAVLVDPEEVLALDQPHVSEDPSLDEVGEILNVGSDAARSLCGSGYLPCYDGKNRYNQATQYVRHSDIEAFRAEYISLSEMAFECSDRFRELQSAINTKRIRPSIPKASKHPNFYRRSEIEALINAIG